MHRVIQGHDYSIHYFINETLGGIQLFNLYGENALFELIRVSKSYNWQIFNTGNGKMIDLEHPERNGYNNFQNYLQQILNKPK
jgi:hypothetical protein